MDLYMKVKTNIRELEIDYFTVKLANGREVFINWDHEKIQEEPDGLTYNCEMVMFDEEDPPENFDILMEGMEVAEVGTFYFDINITEDRMNLDIDIMKFSAGGKEFTLTNAYHCEEDVLHTWKVPVTWMMYGVCRVRAKSLEDAIKKVQNDPEMPLPEGNYIDDSFCVEEDEDVIKSYNN